MRALYYTEIIRTTHQIEKRSLTRSLGTVFQTPICHLYTRISLKLFLPMMSRWLDTTQSVAEETCTQPFLSSMSWSSVCIFIAFVLLWLRLVASHLQTPPLPPHPPSQNVSLQPEPRPSYHGGPSLPLSVDIPCFFFLAPGSTAGISI